MSEPTFKVARDPYFEFRYHSVAEQALPASLQGAQLRYYFLARNAIYHAMSLFRPQPGDQWLVPAYHCRALVEPIAAAGVEVVYYDVGRAGLIDLELLESLLTPRTRGLLAVHYLGFPQPIEEVRRFCDQHKLRLIEDCAHVLSGEVGGRPLGSFGDVSVFSLRKFLPVYDGGVLRINDPSLGICVAADASSVKHELRAFKTLIDLSLAWNPAAIYRLTNAAWSGAWQVIKRRRTHKQPESETHAYVGTQNESDQSGLYSASFSQPEARVAMASVSRVLLSHTKFTDVIAARRSNYKVLRELLLGLGGVTPFHPEPAAAFCPWVLGITVERESFHRVLRERGIPATTWGDVMTPGIHIERFPHARELSERLIFLPVHQCLRPDDLKFMVEGVRDALRARH